MKWNYFLLPILIFGILIIAITFWAKKPAFKINTSQASVVKEMKQLNRLETAQFTIEKVIDASTNNANTFQELLYGDKILLIAHGEVIAGFDLTNLSDKNITITGDKLTIQMPQPQILVTTIDNEKTKVYDRRQGLLSKGNKDLESEARKSAELSIKQAACEAHILTQASENAKKQLKAMFSPFGFSEVDVQIPDGKCE